MLAVEARFGTIDMVFSSVIPVLSVCKTIFVISRETGKLCSGTPLAFITLLKQRRLRTISGVGVARRLVAGRRFEG